MKINTLFKIQNAKSRNLDVYTSGTVPFVSNSNLNNGVVRYVDADKESEVINTPCIAVNGFGFATVQVQPFIGAGNGGIHVIALHPLEKMTILELAYYAAQINHASWRFSYGRRAIQRRLLQVELIKFVMSESQEKKFIEDFQFRAKSSVSSLFD